MKKLIMLFLLSFEYLYRTVVPFSNLTEFLDDNNNSSMPLEEANKSSSTCIFILVLILIIASGIFCVYKNKCQTKSKKFNESNLRRSSLESQDSITSNESIETE